MSHLSTNARVLGAALLLLGVLAGCSSTAPAADGGAESASASVHPASPSEPSSASPSPSQSAEQVLLTYEGRWTLVAYANDVENDEPEYQVGDSRPGTVEIECGGLMADSGHCGATLSWDGQPFSVTSVEIIGDGQLRMVLEDELENCANGQVRRTSIEIDYDEASAEATYERVTEPRTCDDGSGTLYMTDDTWSFEGVGGT